MSELKVHKIGDLCFDFKMGKDVGIDFCLKSDADKVIAEKDAEIAKLQAMLEERNKQVGELEDKLLHYPMMVTSLESDKKEIAELKEERRWRKFPDEKPKHNGIFIVLIGKHAKTLDAYDTNKGKFQTYGPTAWMPLPKAP